MNSTVIISCYNRHDLLERCLQGLRELYPNQEVLVAGVEENRHIARAYNCQHIANPDAFYTERINEAVERVNTEAVILLNDDTYPLSPFVDALLAALAKADLVGALLTYPDGTIQHAGVGFSADYYPFHVARHEEINNHYRADTFPPAVTFACVAFRRSLWKALGGLDTKFIHTYQDIDFNARVKEVGGRIRLAVGARLEHLDAASARRRDTEVRDAQTWRKIWIATGRIQKVLGVYSFNANPLR